MLILIFKKYATKKPITNKTADVIKLFFNILSLKETTFPAEPERIATKSFFSLFVISISLFFVIIFLLCKSFLRNLYILSIKFLQQKSNTQSNFPPKKNIQKKNDCRYLASPPISLCTFVRHLSFLNLIYHIKYLSSKLKDKNSQTKYSKKIKAYN